MSFLQSCLLFRMKDVTSHAFILFSVAYLLYLPSDIPDFKETVILFHIILLYVVQKLLHMSH